MGRSMVITNANLISGFASLNDCGILIKDNIIEDVFSMKRFASKGFGSDTEIIDAKGNLVCAGLIDTHIHGIGGYGTECVTEESILKMSSALASFGVTSFIPTLYPNEKETLFKMEDAVVNAMGHESGARILGINIEGPFISPKRPGALPLNAMSEVNIDYLDEIIDRGKGHVICMTVAPELKHMHELALHAKSRGIVLLAGHTDATYENMIEAMQCGIFHSTHFFNAMSPLHHRNPGAVGAILINPDMCCEVIADGVHVHPELVKMVVKQKPAENIVLVTDSLTPTNQKEGPFYANGTEVVLSKEGAFVSKDDEKLLNGSALTLNRALFNMKSWGIMPELSVRMATENPARIYNLEKLGAVVPGHLADIVIFDSSFNPLIVIINGKINYSKTV